MTIKNALIWWNDWWADKPVDTGVLRENYILQISELLDTREIIVLEGVRRSGKSTIMHQIINKLLTKTSKNNICYVNLDDQRFGNDLEKIFDTYLELSSPDKKIYFFIDEIQNIEFWEKWIKSKYDKNRNIKFIISGSTTTLLSKEYSYLISGRYFRIMVMPFAFDEILNFKKIDFEGKMPPIQNKIKLKRTLAEFIEFGGFPEVVLEKNKKIKTERLKTYFESILLKDVILKNKIRQSNKIEDLAYYSLSNISSLFTYKKLSDALNISTVTAEEYFLFIRDSFLIDSLAFFSYKVKEQLQYPRKIYSIDTGLRNAVCFKFRENLGQLYENMVFIELKRRKKKIYYWKNKRALECDFVVKEGLKITEAIQVCYDIEDPDTKKRELNGLMTAMKEFDLNSGLIITEDFEDRQAIDGKSIRFIPLWKWLIDV